MTSALASSVRRPRRSCARSSVLEALAPPVAASRSPGAFALRFGRDKARCRLDWAGDPLSVDPRRQPSAACGNPWDRSPFNTPSNTAIRGASATRSLQCICSGWRPSIGGSCVRQRSWCRDRAAASWCDRGRASRPPRSRHGIPPPACRLAPEPSAELRAEGRWIAFE